ncbi:MAG TPA: hypothetical protein VMW42_11050 [Desulfatiglandales bacterium]|nr:hypothetical protein [Desulfatiglandales bacterium]
MLKRANAIGSYPFRFAINYPDVDGLLKLFDFLIIDIVVKLARIHHKKILALRFL